MKRKMRRTVRGGRGCVCGDGGDVKGVGTVSFDAMGIGTSPENGVGRGKGLERGCGERRRGEKRKEGKRDSGGQKRVGGRSEWLRGGLQKRIGGWEFCRNRQPFART